MILQQQGHPSLLSPNHNLFSSQRDVFYCCGACGFALNLSSSSRNTSKIGSKYDKSIKKGIISFLSIDESRFTLVDEFSCVPIFFSNHLLQLFRPRTKLLCRKCGNHIGHAYGSTSPFDSDNSDSSSGNVISVCRKYNVRIRALQPSFEDLGIPLVVWYHVLDLWNSRGCLGKAFCTKQLIERFEGFFFFF